MKKVFTLLLFLGITVFGQGLDYLAFDKGDNYYIPTWTNGSNNGYGFNPWSFTDGSSGGRFVSSTPFNSALKNPTYVFGMWGASGYTKAKRTFTPLKENQVLSLAMSTNGVSSGQKGVDILNGSNVLFNINIGNLGGYAYSYLVTGGSRISFGALASDQMITLTLKKLTGSDVQISIAVTSGTGISNQSLTLNSSNIDGIEFYVGDTGGGGANDFFFNSLSIATPLYTSVTSSDWNLGSTWNGGSVPVNNSRIIINNDVTVNNTVTTTTGNVTINSGKKLTFGTSGVLSIDGNFSNSGTLDMIAGGTLKLTGNSTVTGTNSFYNVEISGAANFGIATINNKLTVFSGGSATGTISYGSNSTLEYNGRTGYTASIEWPSSNPPKFVILTSNSSITAPSTTRTLDGNLTINSGSTFTLSGTSGADFVLKGDLSNAGTLSPNGRLFTFQGTSPQTISGGGTTPFAYLKISNDVSLSSTSISVTNSLTIDASKTLTCNSNNITLSGGVSFTNNGSFSAGTGKVVFSGSSTISGTNTFYNVDISGAVSFGTATINNKLAVFSGGSATGTLSYGTNATLEYNGRTGYTASNEWPSSNPPKFVILTSGSSITAPSTTRTLDGDLTINSGSTFTLSGTSGSDFELKGNLVNAGTLSPNGRLFTFLGTSPQTISGSGTTSFTYLKISNDVSLSSTSISVANSLTIDASKTLTCNSNNITISGGGSFTNNGSFSAGTGKVIFSGSGSITGTVGFNNVDISGAVNFGTGSTVNGTLQILPNGAVTTNAPIYATNSTLKYSIGNEYNRFTEWLSTDGGRGLPYNVILSSNTTLNLARSAAPSEVRSINGTLTIEAGSALYMRTEKVGEVYPPMTGTLTINGDISNSGTLALSTGVGGDLIVKGNLTNNGNFTHNTRLVTFNGLSQQIISGSSTTTFGYVVFDNDISLSSGISAANSFVINAAKTLSANAQTITLGSGVNFSNSGIFSAGTGKVVFQGASTITGTNSFNNVEINGTVNFGTSTINNTLTFKSGASASGTITYHATNSTLDYNGVTVSAGNEFPVTSGPANITLNSNANVTLGLARTVSGKVTVASGSTLTVTGAEVFNNFELSGTVNFGTASTLNGTLTFKSGGSVSGTPSYGSSSTLEYSGITSYTTGNEWPSTNGPKNLSLISNASVAVGAERTILGNLLIQSGSTLRVSGDRKITLSGTGASITQNGSIDANPSFGNTLSFDVTGTYSLTGSGNFDVFNCNIKNGGSLSIGSTNMRTGNTGTITIESGGTFSLGSAIVGGYNGTSIFTLNSGSTLKIGSAAGITSSGATGNIQTTTRNFNTGANYTYNGSSAQVTGSGLPATVNSLDINNSAGVTMSGPVTVSTSMSLTSGTLDIGASDLTLGSATLTGGTASNYVKTSGAGKLIRTISGATKTTFPVGNTAYNPVYITNAVSKQFSVRAKSGFTGATPIDASKIILAYWEITPENLTNVSATLEFQWNLGQQAGSFSYGNGVEIGRIVGTSWSSKAATLSGYPGDGPYTVTATGFTAFSEFGVGNAGSLPVELSSFNVAIRNGLVDLKWETKTEINNYGFEVERKSSAADWSKIGFVEGHGTSNSPKYYSYSDKPVGTGKFSYRLKQIDNDGQFEYSPVVEVLVDNLPNGFVLEQNYPNPFNPETSIRFALKEDTKATLKVFNTMGEEVMTLFDGIAEAGRYYDVKFSGNDLSSGFYIYKLVAGDHVSVKKMLLMK